jgi:hypothetical protein
MNIMTCRGQAIAEFLVAVPVVVLLLSWGLPHLQEALQQRMQAQQLSQLSLAQAGLRQGLRLPASDDDYWQQRLALQMPADKRLELSRHQDYAFAQALLPINFLVRHAGGLDMPSDNLWQAAIHHDAGEDEPPMLMYARLSDDWSPRTQGHLEQRPRAISSGELLNNPLMATVQRAFSVLPMGRELSPDELEFGYVETQAVPATALCESTSC